MESELIEKRDEKPDNLGKMNKALKLKEVMGLTKEIRFLSHKNNTMEMERRDILGR